MEPFRILFGSRRSLYAFLVAVLSLLVDDRRSLARQVNGLPQQQQQVQLSPNTSLPGLSERAASINSRYLTPAGTTNLATATGSPASNSALNSGLNPSATNLNSNTVSATNGHDSNRNYASLGQQVQAPVGSAAAITSNSGGGNGQPQTLVANSNPQSSHYSSSSALNPLALSPGTPVMSSTFTYNPFTNQFVPSELSTGSLSQFLSPIGQSIGQPTGQQPLANFAPITSQSSINQPNPFGQRWTGLPSFTGSLYGQRAPTQSYVRRNGQVYSPRYGNQIGVTYAIGQDDDSTFYPQQQTQSGLNELLGTNLNPIDGSLLPATGSYPFSVSSPSYITNNGRAQTGFFDYLQPTNGGQVSAQPTSVSSSVSVSPNSFVGPTGQLTGASSNSVGQDPKSDQCVAADNRHGTCYQASECIKRGGTPMGKCGTSMSSNEISGSSYVCCLFDVTCGQFAAERFVYFRNPNFPNTFDQTRMCRARIGKLDRGVCQFRLDLIRFDVAKPTNGNCSHDMFVVSGQNENYVIPKICGLNDGQHYYVGVDESGVITLHMMMMAFYRRSFEILITQIPCRSDLAAPAHCLQYYMGTHGTIKSFNYDDDTIGGGGGTSSNERTDLLAKNSLVDLINQQQQHQQQLADSAIAAPYGIQFNSHPHQSTNLGHLQARQYALQQALVGGPSQKYSSFGQELFGGYPNDLDYTMCIRKESGFCSITYQLSRGEQGLQPFAVGQSSSSLFGSNGFPVDNLTSNSYAWQSVSTECRDDYLLVGGVRLCSGFTNNLGANFQSPYADQSGSPLIQFAQNGTILNSAGVLNQAIIQQQQLQSQYNLLMQQLARVQQQQQQLLAPGNSSSNSGSANSLNQQGGNLNGQSSQNLDQQQAAIIQQVMVVQQQLSQLASNPNTNIYSNQGGGGGKPPNDAHLSDLQGAIITDTTSGPFILRFVSNTVRNARGFHIDYRQNPCK